MLIFPGVASITISEPSLWSDFLPSLMAGFIGVLGVIIGACFNHYLDKRREKRAENSAKDWWDSEVQGMLEDGVEAMEQLEKSYNEIKETGLFERLVSPRQLDGVFVFDKELIVKGAVSHKERRSLQYIKVHMDTFNQASQELGKVVHGENKSLENAIGLIRKMYGSIANILYNIRVVQGEEEYPSRSRIGQAALQEESERVWKNAEELSGTSIPLYEPRCQCQGRGRQSGPGCRG